MMARWIARVRNDERGAVLVFVAIAMTVLIGSTALAVDIGQVTTENRNLQAVADSVALDAARVMNGQTVSQLSAAGGTFLTALSASAARNNFATADLTTEFGTLSPSWVAKTNATDVPTAVRITARGTTKFAFRPGSNVSTRTATALMENTAGFSIGSWLASIPSGGDGILNSVFGDAFHLNAVSYSGLLNANLSLAEIGLNMPVTALSATQLLSTSVSINNFMLASVAALNAKGNTTAANVLNSMILNASLTGTVKLGDFITVASGTEAAAASASLDVLQLLTASAFVMEKNGGHALSIPTATVSVPGVASLTASATVIEPAKIAFGPVGTSVSTAQVRLSVNPVINIGTGSSTTACNLTLSNLLGLVGCVLYLLGMPIAVTISGSLPLDLTAAGATGTLSAINCATPSITVSSTTQAVNLNAAANLNLNVTLAGSNILNAAQVNIAAGVKTAAGNYSTTFNSPSEFGPSHAKSVGSSALGLNGLLSVTNANVSVLNGTLSTGGVTSALLGGLVTPVLNTLLTNLDNALVVPLAKVLGVKFGGADIAALGVKCNGLRLAG